MSFSSNVKDEILSNTSLSKSEQRAELSALLHVIGSIGISQGNLNIVIHTENAGVARRAIKLMHSLYEVKTQTTVSKGQRLNKKSAYSVHISGDVVSILKDTGYISDEETAYISMQECINEKIINGESNVRAFFRGAFLGAGSLSNPKRGYHLEFVIEKQDFAENLCSLLCKKGLSARVIERKKHYVVYIKESEHIADLLIMMGAHNAILAMENVKILKQMRNDANRATNCETANIDKTLNASYRQLDSIKYIKETVGLSALPTPLEDIARLRMENAEASLSELGMMMGGQLGRSGINHRLRKIDKFAMDLRNERGE